MPNTKTLSILQVGSSPEGTNFTLNKILGYEDDILKANTDILVLPEAILGGYPKGESFGTQLGFRMESGRETYKNYFGLFSAPGSYEKAVESFYGKLSVC